MPNKKIAVCISGQPRFLMEGASCLNHNLISRHDCDVFIHAWFNPNELNGSGYGGKFSLRQDAAEKITELYSPKDMIIEEQKAVGPNYNGYLQGASEATKIFVHYSMFYSIMKANFLKQQHEKKMKFKYDIVVRTRFDAALLKPIDSFVIEENKVVGIDAIDSDDKLSDWLFYGNSKIMDDICGIYYDLKDYEQSLANFCGENILWKKIEGSGYDVYRLFPSQQGSNLVLVRGAPTSVKGWMYHNDVPKYSA